MRIKDRDSRSPSNRDRRVQVPESKPLPLQYWSQPAHYACHTGAARSYPLHPFQARTSWDHGKTAIRRSHSMRSLHRSVLPALLTAEIFVDRQTRSLTYELAGSSGRAQIIPRQNAAICDAELHHQLLFGVVCDQGDCHCNHSLPPLDAAFLFFSRINSGDCVLI